MQSPSPQIQASEPETGDERDIDFVETEQEEDADEGYVESDWGNETKDIEDEQSIPLDHNLHGKLSDTTFVAFGQYFPSGKVVSKSELYSMRDRVVSAGQRLEKIPMWLDVSPATDEAANALGEIFAIHPLTIDDWFTPDSREKAAFFENYFAISVIEMRYIDDTNILKTFLLHIVIKKNVIITVHNEPILAVSEVRSKIRDKYQGSFPSAHWVLYAILELIIQKFSVLNDKLYTDVYNVEQLSLVLLHDDQDEFLGRIGDLKKRASTLQFLVSPKKTFLRFILKSKSNLVSKNLKIYLRDILDDTVRLLEKLSTLTHSIENHQQTYLAKISLSVNRYTEEENMVMKKFSLVQVLFLPMTFITALFGMNVTVPGQENPTLIWFGIIIAACMLWFIGSVIFYTIHFKWI